MSLDEIDYTVEVWQSKPPGGQSCGLIPTAVRVTHISGIMAQCSHGRSQLANKRICLEMIEWALNSDGVERK